MTSASLILPAAIDAYFQASNSGDPDAIAESFAEDALIHDEGEDLRGRESIRAWAHKTRAKYSFTSVPNAITSNGDDVTVTSLVSGSFPGSPITLHYDFTLRNGEIIHLVIHD
jgi:uncharacterized protein (TIGR02246 family)